MKIRTAAALLMLCIASVCCGENFEKLAPWKENARNSLTKAGWTVSGKYGLPYGWYIGKFGVKDPEYRVVESPDPKQGKCIFIRGGFTVDATLVKQQEDHEYVVMEFSAKAENKNSYVVLYAYLMDKKGKNLGQRGYSKAIGTTWAKHQLKLKMPKRPPGVETRITPGFYSQQGIYLDDVTFRSASEKEFSIPPVPQKKKRADGL